jgi:hypothetical protein
VARQIDRGPAHDEDPDKVAEGVAGMTAAAAGAAAGGAVAGPLGLVLGGLAGALGGWWAGRAFAHSAGDFDDETDEHYRRLHEEQFGDRITFDEARDYYRLGYIARRNPDYEGRRFGDVEPELRRGFHGDARNWDDVRDFIHRGYEHHPGG